MNPTDVRSDRDAVHPDRVGEEEAYEVEQEVDRDEHDRARSQHRARREQAEDRTRAADHRRRGARIDHHVRGSASHAGSEVQQEEPDGAQLPLHQGPEDRKEQHVAADVKPARWIVKEHGRERRADGRVCGTKPCASQTDWPPFARS